MTSPTEKSDVDQAMVNLGARHPLAPWLATGGAHTGGAYYTIDVDSLLIRPRDVHHILLYLHIYILYHYILIYKYIDITVHRLQISIH